MKITVEIEVTEEDLRAAHYQFMFGGHADDGGSMDPQDMVDLVMKPAIRARLHVLRSKMRWRELKVGEGPHLQRDDNGFRVRVMEPREGGHRCKRSPTGHCWYDNRDDPAWDFCVFCDEPDERK